MCIEYGQKLVNENNQIVIVLHLHFICTELYNLSFLLSERTFVFILIYIVYFLYIYLYAVQKYRPFFSSQPYQGLECVKLLFLILVFV